MLRDKENKKKDFGYYMLLVLTCILLFVGIFLFDILFNKIGFTKKQIYLSWLWLTVTVAYIPIIFQMHKRLQRIVKFILSANAVFLTTLYIIVLLFFDKNGYDVIPKKIVESWVHGLCLIWTIFFINELILLKFLKKKYRKHKEDDTEIIA